MKTSSGDNNRLQRMDAVYSVVDGCGGADAGDRTAP